MHTPGPWKFSHKGDGTYRIEARQGPLDVMPATVYGLSDALLIAAAPTMLSVLEMCRHVLKDRDQSEQEVKVYNAVRAVIHLATEPRP